MILSESAIVVFDAANGNYFDWKPLKRLAISFCKFADNLGSVYSCFPYDSLLDWNIKKFGPLFVPGKGDAVRIDRMGGEASRIWKSEDSYTGDILWNRVWKRIE